MALVFAGSSLIQTEKISEAHGNSQFEAFRKFHEIPRAFKDLVGNPTFTFLNLAGASEGFLISGFAAFLPKLIENEFSVSASFAAVLMGEKEFLNKKHVNLNFKLKPNRNSFNGNFRSDNGSCWRRRNFFRRLFSQEARTQMRRYHQALCHQHHYQLTIHFLFFPHLPQHQICRTQHPL